MMRGKGKWLLSLIAFLLVLTWSLQAAPKGLGLEDNTLENVSKKVFVSVVKVEARNGVNKVATGVVIDKDGNVITTSLISPRDEEIVVTTSDGRRIPAKFLGLDPETHLALIQTKDKNLIPITPGTAEGLAPGSWVGVISISPENTPAVTQGIVSSVAPDRLRLNVWVTRGASGSPVVNKDGQMVGLLRGIFTEDQPVLFEFREREVVGSGYVFGQAEAPSSGMALAIPVNIVNFVTAEIKEKGRVSRGWVGVSISQNEKGQVEINSVEDDSPAKLAKLQEGDILLTIDGKKITGAPMFVSEIRNKKPGQDSKIEVEREGKTVEAKVKLGEYPEGEAQRELEARFPRLFPPQPPQPPAKSTEPAEPKMAKPEKAPKPPSRLREAVPAWPGWEKRKYIGVYLQEVNKELLDFFGVKDDKGLLVNSLTKDSPAEKAGLKVGDVIIRVDGQAVGTVADLSELIQDKKKGDKVKVDLIRDKKPMTVEIEVAEEESPSLSYFYETLPSKEAVGELTKELQGQYARSREYYERYNTETRDKLKKLTEEMTLKYKDANYKNQALLEKYQAEAAKKAKSLSGKYRVFYRA
jgi:S1-C subfamily serine protease